MQRKTLPNIIHITSHDLGRFLGCYGIQTVHTPAIDAFAASGVLFENAFCAAPQCSPSRAAAFTGRYPHSNGTMGLTHGLFGWNLHPDEIHLAKVLRHSGYETFLGSYQHECRRTFEHMGFDASAKVGGDAPELGKKTAAWFESRKGNEKPFYLQLSLNEPHRAEISGYFSHPHDLSKGVTVPPYLQDDSGARDEMAFFQGSVRALDTGIGILLEGLKQTGLEDDTLVVFTTDHGIPFPRAKCTLYDPGIEIAHIIRWPARLSGGRRLQACVSNVDFMPTLLKLLGIDSCGIAFQGRSYARILMGESQPWENEIFAEMTYHEYCDPMRCVRKDGFKLIANFSTARSFMDSSQQWRPVTSPKVPLNPASAHHEPVELYDLHADPHEQVNLVHSSDHEEPRRVLLAGLHQWMQETNDPLLLGIPTPPIYHMTMSALRTGMVSRQIEEVCPPPALSSLTQHSL